MSEMAPRLIAQTEKEKATVLDLGMCGLTTLPEELFTLHWLEELYVCNSYYNWEKREWIESKNKGNPNKLDTIPAHIQNLKWQAIISGKVCSIAHILCLGYQLFTFFYQNNYVIYLHRTILS